MTEPAKPPTRQSCLGWILRLPFNMMYYTWHMTSVGLKYMLTPRPSNTQFTLAGTRPPKFFEGTFQQAVTKAKNEFKFLVVYLHSSQHGDTAQFCRDVLCTERVASFLEENFILWGGDINYKESYQVSYFLGATAYPFFGILCNLSNSAAIDNYLRAAGYTTQIARGGTILLYKIQGNIGQDHLIKVLTDVLENQGPILVAAMNEAEERERDRQMRQVQDQEYQESLRKDREKEQQRIYEEEKKKAELRMEEEKRQQEEELRRKDEEERLERERRQQEEDRKLKEEQDKLIQQLSPEPPKGPNTTDLAIRFSDGSRVTRRFYQTDKLRELFIFIRTRESLQQYTVATHYPRKTFSDPELTFLDSGLCPHAAVFVEEVLQ